MAPWYDMTVTTARDNSYCVKTTSVCKNVRNTYNYVNLFRIMPSLQYYVEDIGVWTHNACICNEYIGMVHRHQVATPPFFGEKFLPLLHEALEIFEKQEKPMFEQYTLLTREKVLASYQGEQYRKYFWGYMTLKKRSIIHQDSTVRIFPKDQKEYDYALKAPRMIQFRGPVYMLEAGRCTQAIEHDIYRVKDEYNTLVFGKGANNTVLGSEFLSKVSNFINPIYLMLDASKFDAHISVELLQFVAEVYPKFFTTKRNKQYIRFLWGKTFVNYGFSRRGLRFKTEGTRMSGDMDTGLGNCILMYCLLKAFFQVCGITKNSVMVNGDDSVCIIEGNDFYELEPNFDWWKSMGFSMKMEYTYDLSKVEFCKTRLLRLPDGTARFVPDPIKWLQLFGYSTVRRSKKALANNIYTLCLCEMAFSWGLPTARVAYKILKYISTKHKCVLQRFSRRFWRVLKMYENFGNHNQPPLDEHIAQSYFKLFDLDASVLQVFEGKFDFSNYTGFSLEGINSYHYRTNPGYHAG